MDNYIFNDVLYGEIRMESSDKQMYRPIKKTVEISHRLTRD